MIGHPRSNGSGQATGAVDPEEVVNKRFTEQEEVGNLVCLLLTPREASAVSGVDNALITLG